jgi:hypothetical protein
MLVNAMLRYWLASLCEVGVASRSYRDVLWLATGLPPLMAVENAAHSLAPTSLPSTPHTSQLKIGTVIIQPSLLSVIVPI